MTDETGTEVKGSREMEGMERIATAEGKRTDATTSTGRTEEILPKQKIAEAQQGHEKGKVHTIV